jgi:hypothetical protein
MTFGQFFTAFTAAYIVISLRWALVSGRVRVRAVRETFTREDDPAAYWLTIVVTAMIGVIVVGAGMISLYAG